MELFFASYLISNLFLYCTLCSYMFWTDWGREPRIERADMDGLNRLTLITHNLGWPNGITVDTKTSRIIWVDAKTEVL
jgi:Low-density lipoprotein receptor repeat class B